MLTRALTHFHSCHRRAPTDSNRKQDLLRIGFEANCTLELALRFLFRLQTQFIQQAAAQRLAHTLHSLPLFLTTA